MDVSVLSKHGQRLLRSTVMTRASGRWAARADPQHIAGAARRNRGDRPGDGRPGAQPGLAADRRRPDSRPGGRARGGRRRHRSRRRQRRQDGRPAVVAVPAGQANSGISGGRVEAPRATLPRLADLVSPQASGLVVSQPTSTSPHRRPWRRSNPWPPAGDRTTRRRPCSCARSGSVAGVQPQLLFPGAGGAGHPGSPGAGPDAAADRQRRRARTWPSPGQGRRPRPRSLGWRRQLGRARIERKPRDDSRPRRSPCPGNQCSRRIRRRAVACAVMGSRRRPRPRYDW